MSAVTPDTWLHWSFTLGFGGDLLPVAPAGSPPTAGSNVKEFGKIPSGLSADGHAFGIKGWQKREISSQEVDTWSRDPRLGICVRSSACRAIDIDITDVELAAQVSKTVADYVRDTRQEPARRFRSNSSKCLFPVRLEGAYDKRIIKTKDGSRVEFLADGQQFVVAGMHPSGAPYEWDGGQPEEIPTLTPEQFEELWCALQSFSVEPVKADTSSTQATPAIPATEISESDLKILQDALHYEPLVKAAEADDVWAEIGYSLLSTQQIDLWLDFSSQHAYATGYDPDAALAWWRAHQDALPRVDYTHIVKMARGLGWTGVEFGEFVADETVDDDSRFGIVGDLPSAHYDTTDLANAHRLKDTFGGKRLIVVSGLFYAWTGKCWICSESEAHRCAAELSCLLQKEIDDAKTLLDSLTIENSEWKALSIETIARPDHSAAVKHFGTTPEGAKILSAHTRLKALRAWQKACEQEPVQSRAVKILRNTLEPSPRIVLDKDAHLLNCNNGTVDMRTGLLKPHDPRDFITKISPIDYNPDAVAPRFESFLREILADDTQRAAFVQRWYGYCATGETLETAVAFFIGAGSNGKSTLVELTSSVLGDYAQPAPRGLIMRGSEKRHPAELADLAGKRLMMITETGVADEINEELFKQLVSVEEIKARPMYGDFFSFKPTHKFTLQTNKKPFIHGQDYGIWRRILLVDFPVRYGKPEDVQAGKADKLRDENLIAALREEREGILAWIVRGSVEWYRTGLKPPASVIQAVNDYQSESNRLGAFVEGRCVVEADQTCRPADLFNAYTCWCKSNGYRPMASGRFYQEFTQAVPYVKRVERKELQPNGKRKSVYLYMGLRVENPADMPIPGASISSTFGSMTVEEKAGALI